MANLRPTSPLSTNPLDNPIPDAPGYYYVLDTRGRPRVYSGRRRRLLALAPVIGRNGPRWYSQIRLPGGRVARVFPAEMASLEVEEAPLVSQLEAAGARALPDPFGSLGFVMTPHDAFIYRIIPSTKSRSSTFAPRRVATFLVRGIYHVSLPLPDEHETRDLGWPRRHQRQKPRTGWVRQTNRALRTLFRQTFPELPLPDWISPQAEGLPDADPPKPDTGLRNPPSSQSNSLPPVSEGDHSPQGGQTPPAAS